jgi:hypothetical protein
MMKNKTTIIIKKGWSAIQPLIKLIESRGMTPMGSIFTKIQ